jgi:hypothetical protein
MFPTKAAMAFDDLAYPRSWEGEHFPVSLEQHQSDGAHRKASKAAKGAKGAKSTKSTKAAKPAKRGGTVGNTWD